MCILIFDTTLSETFLGLRRIKQDVIIKMRRSASKVPIILVKLNETRIFSEDL